MTLDNAVVTAIRKAKKTGREWFVIHSPEPGDKPLEHYQVAREDELETFFIGAPVVFSTADRR